MTLYVSSARSMIKWLIAESVAATLESDIYKCGQSTTNSVVTMLQETVLAKRPKLRPDKWNSPPWQCPCAWWFKSSLNFCLRNPLQE
jgi:hypothetical protein